MSITISVSEKTEQIIREKAEEIGKDASDFAGHLLEEKVKEEFPEKKGEEKYENPFEPFIGMFASGITDTSTRYKKILREEIDNHGGFGGS